MLLKTIAGVSLLAACVLFACLGWALWTLPLLFAGIYAAIAVFLTFKYIPDADLIIQNLLK